jgi:hypothetical protein
LETRVRFLDSGEFSVSHFAEYFRGIFVAYISYMGSVNFSKFILAVLVTQLLFVAQASASISIQRSQPIVGGLDTVTVTKFNFALTSSDVFNRRNGFEDTCRDFEYTEKEVAISDESQSSYLGKMFGFTRNIFASNKLTPAEIEAARVAQSAQAAKDADPVQKMKDAEAASKIANSNPNPYAYFSKRLEFDTGSAGKLWAKANARAMGAQIGFASHGVTSSIEMNGNASDSRSPSSIYSADPMTRSGERFKLCVSRPLEFFGLNSTLVYVGTSRVFDAAISKTIFPHFNVVVDSFYPVSVDATDVKVPGSALKAVYEVHF